MSKFLIAPLLAWLLAQTIKYLVRAFSTKRWKDARLLYRSGNMPSSHTAMVTALLVVVGAIEGVDSATFGITAIFSLIIAYDATQVRRSSGEQGQAIADILKKLGLKNKPHQALGHKPVEVLVGAMVGIGAALGALSF